MTRFALVALLAAGALATASWAGAAGDRSSSAAQHVTIQMLAAPGGREAVSDPNFAVRPGIPVTVTLVNSTREYHTFTVPKLGVSALALPGSPSKPRATHVTFTVPVTGVFSWHCVFCPAVHHEGPMGGHVYAIIGA